MPQIDISYGILHYNPNTDLEARTAFICAADSLAINRSFDFNSEVFIIDQGNPSEEQEISRDIASYHNFNYIALNKNIGISRGINFLAHIARGRYISLVTSDTIFLKGLDNILIEDLENNKQIFQICPLSDYSSIEYQCKPYGNRNITYCIANELTIQFWPRVVFDKIGFFDENWKACFENLDYSLRIFLNGGFAAISNRVTCNHKHNTTTKNGSINKSYEGYIDMPNGLDSQILRHIWNTKWPYFNWNFLYSPNSLNTENRELLYSKYKNNVYLPYIQNVGY